MWRANEKRRTNDPAPTEFVFVVLSADTHSERTHKGDTHQSGGERKVFERERAIERWGARNWRRGKLYGMLCGNRSSSMWDQPCVWWRSPSSMVCSRSSPSDSRGTTETPLCFFAFNLRPKACHHPILMLTQLQWCDSLVRYWILPSKMRAFFCVCQLVYVSGFITTIGSFWFFTIWNTNYPQLGEISSIASGSLWKHMAYLRSKLVFGIVR